MLKFDPINNEVPSLLFKMHVDNVNQEDGCDLRKYISEPKDENDLNDSAAWGWGVVIENVIMKTEKASWKPSRMFLYYCQRAREGTIADDVDAKLFTGSEVINKFGVASEHAWPYDPTKFAIKPSRACYTLAASKKFATFRIAQNTSQIKQALLAGLPVLFGMADELGDRRAYVIVGYDQPNYTFIIRDYNKYFTLPFEIVEDQLICRDFWTCGPICKADYIEKVPYGILRQMFTLF